MIRIVSRFTSQWILLAAVSICLLLLAVYARPAAAITALPTPSPIPGSYGLEATKTKPAPTEGATITTPGNGGSFTTTPITVSGICPTDLLIEVYDNGVMAGAVMCKGGSFSLQVSLFAGANALTALDYDDLGQSGPAGNTNTVTYTDLHLTAFGQLVTLTSSYGRRSAAAGSQLDWPLQLSGGAGPYAFSIDWGDGTPTQLKSAALAGLITISHAYKSAGIYQVNVKVTDVNGVSAFLQLIAVANGQVDSTTAGSAGNNSSAKTVVTKPEVLWIPTILLLVLLLPTYWLGRRSQLISLRNKMLRDRDRYEAEQK